MYRSIDTAVKLVVLLGFAIVSGCASAPAQKRKDSSELYDGKPRAVFGTEFPVGSSAEAAARGDLAARKGDLDRALYFYVEAISLEPTDVNTLLKIGAIHTRRNNDRLALGAYRQVLAQEPNNALALEGAGLALLDLRENEAARDLLEQAVVQDIDRWRAHDGLGVLADLRQDYDSAISHYGTALIIHPNSPRLHNNRGYSRYLAGDLSGAVEDFERALEINPKFERAWRNIGLVRVRQERYTDALEAFKMVEGEAQALNDVGYLTMLEGRFDIAEHFLYEAIATSPSYYRVAYQNLDRVREMRDTGVKMVR